jgi:hypothetical protein
MSPPPPLPLMPAPALPLAPPEWPPLAPPLPPPEAPPDEPPDAPPAAAPPPPVAVAPPPPVAVAPPPPLAVVPPAPPLAVVPACPPLDVPALLVPAVAPVPPVVPPLLVVSLLHAASPTVEDAPVTTRTWKSLLIFMAGRAYTVCARTHSSLKVGSIRIRMNGVAQWVRRTCVDIGKDRHPTSQSSWPPEIFASHCRVRSTQSDGGQPRGAPIAAARAVASGRRCDFRHPRKKLTQKPRPTALTAAAATSVPRLPIERQSPGQPCSRRAIRV